MKKIHFILSAWLLFILNHRLHSQSMADIFSMPDSKYAAGVYGSIDYSSNSVTTNFAANYETGSYINEGMKQEVVSKLSNFNRLGFELNYGLYGILYRDTLHGKRLFNFFFSLSHKDYFNTLFTYDDFYLGFYGNAPYAGKTAVLSPFSLNSLSYQKIEIGALCTNFGGTAQFGGGLSFLAGQQYTALNASGSTLYTDALGQYITLNSNAQAYLSDTSGNSLVNGYGASLDIYFRAPYKVGKKKGKISVAVNDLGFIWWNEKSLTYNKDTSYTYNGITINSITDLQKATYNSLSKDSLQSKYFPLKKQSFYSVIPTTLSINTWTNFITWQLEVGFNYIFNANANGYGYIQFDKPFAKRWQAAVQLGYGGYATINGGLMITKETKKSKIIFGFNHLQGLVLIHTFGGAGLSAEYVRLF